MFQSKKVLGALMNKRVVVLEGKIQLKQVDRVADKLLALNHLSSEEITLIINTEGGEVMAGLTLCDLIEFGLSAPVRGIVIGRCCSIGTFILLSCAKKCATTNAQFLFHRSSVSDALVKGDKQRNITDLLLQTTSTDSILEAIYLRKLRITPEKLRELQERGERLFNVYFGCSEAIEIGLIEEVITEKLGFF